MRSCRGLATHTYIMKFIDKLLDRISKPDSTCGDARRQIDCEKALHEMFEMCLRPDKTGSTDPRIEMLITITFDLLMEVEALRSAQLEHTEGGPIAKDSAYRQAYRKTALLTHNSAGPSSGVAKLLACFYPTSVEEDGRVPLRARSWRECVMLRRLGFSEGEIREYKDQAEDAESLT